MHEGQVDSGPWGCPDHWLPKPLQIRCPAYDVHVAQWQLGRRDYGGQISRGFTLGYYIAPFQRVLQVSVSDFAENWANSQILCLGSSSGLGVHFTQIQFALVRRQVTQQRRLGGSVQQSVGAQQYRRIGQQGHAPSQAQAVQEHLAQS